MFQAVAQEGQIVRVTVHSPSLEGNLFGNTPDRLVTIYLPLSYDLELERRYPVVYLLHGYTGITICGQGELCQRKRGEPEGTEGAFPCLPQILRVP